MEQLLIDPKVLEDARKLARDFVASVENNSAPLYAFGRNVYSKGLIANFKIAGVVDDYTDDKTWNNTRVLRLAEVPANALIIVCSGGKTQSALKTVKAAGLKALDYFAFLRHSGNPQLPDIVFNENFSEEFASHETEFNEIWNRLQDTKSRDIFRRLVNFRLNPYLQTLEGFQDNQKNQYFEDFLKLGDAGKGSVFVDIGCFDGATSIEFARRTPGYGKIIAFEPEPSNLVNCRRNLANLKNVEIQPYGVGSKDMTLRISKDGSASTVSSEGESEIHIRRLDDILRGQHVDLIKIDIEGAEGDALDGARETISTQKPQLAISVYHKAGDFWRIPKQILGINPDYKLYMRHYTETIYETVMFFIP